MAGYTVAHLDEIEEFSDAGCHYRPIRHHLGITAIRRLEDLDVSYRSQQRAQPRADDRVIIHQEDLHPIASRSSGVGARGSR